MLRRTPLQILTALTLSMLVPALGYTLLGAFFAVIFLGGYLAGFLLWLFVSSNASWESIRRPYWLTFGTFLFLHKVEENRTGFFDAVSSRITGVPVPKVTVGLVLGLLVVPLGLWLATPPLLRRSREMGYLLAWTFFASMSITELAHFLMPVLAHEPYGYFPGMASAAVLAPLGWWGMWRMACSREHA